MSGVVSDFWKTEVVRSAIAGSWHARGTGEPEFSGGVGIDTRALRRGDVFFALRGERVDGHAYLRQAAEAGASLAIVDDPPAIDDPPADLPILRVPDCRAALGRLASAYRSRLTATRFVAVTGSNGKTTTTRMIDACLSASMRGRRSPKSYNNDLGVPLTVFTARPGDRYVVCEVGANAPGEIEPLSSMIRPDVVVITSIGRAHLEGFGSVESIAREKLSLASHMADGGLLIHTADSPPLERAITGVGQRLRFGRSADADLRVGDIAETFEGLTFTINERATFGIPCLGPHNALNATAAIAVARRLGVDDETIRGALSEFEGAEMRLACSTVAGVRFVNDAYNANPDSMLAALRTLVSVAAPGSRRVAVLGDMLELGEATRDAHLEVGRALAEQRAADLVILVGECAAEIAAPLRDADVAIPCELVGVNEMDRVASLLREGDTVLLKGSRGIALERVLETFGRQHEAVEPAR